MATPTNRTVRSFSMSISPGTDAIIATFAAIKHDSLRCLFLAVVETDRLVALTFRAELHISFLAQYESRFLGNPYLSFGFRGLADEVVAVYDGRLAVDRLVAQILARFFPVTARGDVSQYLGHIHRGRGLDRKSKH